jgi:hypothetical protein
MKNKALAQYTGRSLWVVEMWNDQYKTLRPRWESTVGVALTKADGIREMREWRNRNNWNYGKFRLVRYAP